MRSGKLTCIAILFLSCSFNLALADVKLPAVLSDHMVLQQKSKVKIWGWADSGEKVRVKADWQMLGISTKADADGKWMVKIKTPKAGGPYQIDITGKNAIQLKNVLVGEVWVCSGQSNMQMPVTYTSKWNKGVINYVEEIAAANYPQIRLFTVPPLGTSSLKEDVNGNWSQCSPESIPTFSAVAYFFGRHLHKELDVPIGLIHSAFGGTPAESWTSIETLEAGFGDLLERHKKDYPIERENYKKSLKKWEEDKANALAKGEADPPKPGKPGAFSDSWQPSWLYNAMISPLINYGIKGVIWYQGESNGGRAYQYRTLFPEMIQDWRHHWGQGDFPFYFVQISSFSEPTENPVEDAWAELREAQLMTLDAVEHTGMAVSIDIGEAKDIHPSKKKEVGDRLARWAMAKTYGHKEIKYSGPNYRSMKVEGNRIRLFFDHIDGGLVAKDGSLKQFAIAGQDRKFVWAKAKIDGKTIVVQSNQIREPVAVRYAWAFNPEGCNLYNEAGLPASPFRTDQWPGITKGNF